MSESKLCIHYELVIGNNGQYYNNTNQCGIRSIADAMGIHSIHYLEFLQNNFLQLQQHEMLDFSNPIIIEKMKELCDLFNCCIVVHCAKHLDNGMVRIWQTEQLKIQPVQKDFEIHLLWYGQHFEFVNWNRITDYPDFNEKIYNQIREAVYDPEQILCYYNVISSGV